MRATFLLLKPSAVLPIVMSVLALLVVLAHLLTRGTAREADEGTAAHLFQIFIAGQVPLILFFLLKWLPSRPKQALATLALQAGMALLAMSPVFYFNL